MPNMKLAAVILVSLASLASVSCVTTCKPCWIPGFLQTPDSKCVDPWFGVDEGDGCVLIVESHVTCPTAADLHVPGQETCTPAVDRTQAFPCTPEFACPQGYDRCQNSPGFCCPGETR